MQKEIFYMGGKKLGYLCLNFLIQNKKDLEIKIKGALVNRAAEEKEFSLIELCRKEKIPVLKDLKEFENFPPVDIIIVVQYHEILKSVHIKKAKEIAINLHMAPLPEYRGCNQFTYAIINKDKEFGTTIHRLEEKVDAGAIIAEKRFPIPSGCFVYELYKITEEKSYQLFKENIKNIIQGNYKLIPQSKLIPQRGTSYHYRKEIEKLKHIKLEWEREKIERYIRATYMPGYTPPYFYIEGRKFYIIEEKDFKSFTSD